MSGLAELLLNLGYTVSGSDLRRTKVMDNLSGLGGEMFHGHRAEHVTGADVVVYSSRWPETTWNWRKPGIDPFR